MPTSNLALRMVLNELWHAMSDAIGGIFPPHFFPLYFIFTPAWCCLTGVAIGAACHLYVS